MSEVRTAASHMTLGDCLSVMKDIEAGSVDLILADLPYGTTYASWDAVIPFPAMWEAFKRVAKDSTPIVLTASQPFTAALIMSAPEMFRCEWIWDKVNASNFANAKRQPLKQHESVLVFSKKQSAYLPEKVAGAKNHSQGRSQHNTSELRLITKRVEDDKSGLKYPKTIITFPKHSSQSKHHPTEKPVDLLRYLIRTYSLPGELVLDPTMGSGSTGVAALAEGRAFRGIEVDPGHFATAVQRLHSCCGVAVA